MTLESYRAPLLHYTKLCASFQSHRWSQTWVTVRKCSSRVKIGDFLSRVTLKFDGWHWETIGHLFYTTLSFVHHFKAMGEFKLELQSGSAKFTSKSAFFSPCDLEIWWMSIKNISAPLLYFFKLCASFRAHWWVYTGVTVRKRPIWVKIDYFFSRTTLKFDQWPSIGHLFYATSSFVHHFVPSGEFKLELQSGNAQFGQNRRFFLAMWPRNLTDDPQKQ